MMNFSLLLSNQNKIGLTSTKFSLFFILFLLPLMCFAQISSRNNNAEQFNIANTTRENYPELVQLILNAESMDNEERQYWFDELPRMNERQIARLFNILETERVKLIELERRYQQEIRELTEKYAREEAQRRENQQAKEDIPEDIDPQEVLERLKNLNL